MVLRSQSLQRLVQGVSNNTDRHSLILTNRCHSDMCFPGYRVSRTHIPKDPCFPAHISLGIRVSLKTLSVIYVSHVPVAIVDKRTEWRKRSQCGMPKQLGRLIILANQNFCGV